MTKLGTVDIMFPRSTIATQMLAQETYVIGRVGSLHIIVARVSIHESVHEETVEGESPIIWRRMVCVILVDSGIVQWVYCLLVHIQVPVDISLIVAKSLGSRGAQRQRQQPLATHCVVLGSSRGDIETNIQRHKGGLAIGRCMLPKRQT